MEVVTIEMEQDEAHKKYLEYRELVKSRKAKTYNELRKAYRALDKGHKLIDIYAAFNSTGKATNDLPKLAIARADQKQIYFLKLENGAGQFTPNRTSWGKQSFTGNVDLPEHTFEEFTRPLVRGGAGARAVWGFENERMATNVPIIPAHLTPDDKLENYFILFEVSEWNRVATVKDPYLLQRINANTFVVLAEWDVTASTAVIMRGRSLQDA